MYREDYPERDDENWNRVILIDRKENEASLTTEVVDSDWPHSERKDDMGNYRWG